MKPLMSESSVEVKDRGEPKIQHAEAGGDATSTTDDYGASGPASHYGPSAHRQPFEPGPASPYGPFANQTVAWTARDLLAEWPWEALACALSVVTMAALVVTIQLRKGLPLPQWPLGISINTLLSIYSMFLKACVTFVLQSCIGQLQWLWFRSERSLLDLKRYDAAGRGAWGSALWLWAYHGRQPLVTLGAVVFVLSVASDPFFQQVVRYADCAAAVKGTSAALARTNYIDGRHLYGTEAETMLVGAQASIVAGALEPVKPLAGFCPTGNCTFDTFDTAGYCSTCEDVSSSLKFDFSCHLDKTPYPNSIRGCNSSKSYDMVIRSYLPSNITTALTNTTMLWNASSYLQDMDLMAVRMPTRNPEYYQPSAFEIILGKTYFSENGFSPLTGEPITGCENADPSDWRCRGFGAASCMLHPCVRTYRVSMEAGVVSQHLLGQTSRGILNTFPSWDPNSGHFGSVGSEIPFVILNVSCVSPRDKEELRNAGYNTDATWTAYIMPDKLNITSHPPADAPFPASLFSGQCAYLFDSGIDYTLWKFVRDSSFMAGNVTGFLRSVGGVETKMVSFAGPQELQSLYNATNISMAGIARKFDDIAESFTQYLRAAGQENFSEPAAGTVLHYAVCLESSWAWATLPAALVVGILALFPLTVAASARRRLPVWKSSTLPLVFRGPMTGDAGAAPLLGREGSPEEDGLTDSIWEMEKKADRTIVWLDGSGGRYKLVKMPSAGERFGT